MKSKKLLLFTITGLLSLSLLLACNKKAPRIDKLSSGKNLEEVELLVSAAASMTDVLGEIALSYKEVAPNIKLVFTFGPSGGLQAQIEEGAPVDIFISAAQKQMNALKEKDLLVEETIYTLLVNKVVLITPKEDNIGITSFKDLTSNANIKKIALGDPSNVPVGQYSEEIFTSLNILDQIKEKAIYGSDVRTVLTWVENKEVDAGLVYETDAMTSDKVKIVRKAPEGSHKEVTYPLSVIKTSKYIEEAKEFLAYLRTSEAGEIFTKYGFSVK